MYTAITPIDIRKESTADHVFRVIREKIVSMDLKPHQQISRTELAKAFGVSQTPVREALLRLEEVGLVDVIPQSKTEIAPIDSRRITETQFLRRALEIEVCLTVADRITQYELSAIQDRITHQEALVNDDSRMSEFLKLDRQFHRSLFQVADQESLHDLILDRSVHLDRLRRLQLPLKGKRERIIADHKRIFDAVVSREYRLIIEAIHAHLPAVPWALEELRAAHPDYFV